MTHLRTAVALVGMVFALAACGEERLATGPSREAVVAAHVEAGESAAVAECIVGIGERRYTLADLMPSATPSSAVQVIVDGCRMAETLQNEDDDGEPPALAFSNEPHDYGDDAALDRLWDACAEGNGAACDELFEDAPIGSEYERFGVTCGDRPEVLDCTRELDGLEEGD